MAKVRMLNFLETRICGTTKPVFYTGIGKLKVYFTPELMLDEEETEISGNTLTTVGLFFFKEEIEGSATSNMYRMSAPMKTSMTFSSTYKEKVKLVTGGPLKEYHVFELHNGDMLIKDVYYTKNTNAMLRVITKYIHGGKMPANIAYDKVLEVYLDIFKIYDTKLNIPSVILELMLSQFYRSKSNASIPMRQAYNGTSVGPYDYKQIRVMKVPELESTFAGITATDVSHQLLSAILRKKDGKKEKESFIEKYLHY